MADRLMVTVLVLPPLPRTPAQIRERRQRITLEVVFHALLGAATFITVRSLLS